MKIKELIQALETLDIEGDIVFGEPIKKTPLSPSIVKIDYTVYADDIIIVVFGKENYIMRRKSVSNMEKDNSIMELLIKSKEDKTE